MSVTIGTERSTHRGEALEPDSDRLLENALVNSEIVFDHMLLVLEKKYQNSTFNVRFLLNVYRFRTVIKSNKCTQSHHQSGTVCTRLENFPRRVV